MTDRELLELAAKAADMHWGWDEEEQGITAWFDDPTDKFEGGAWGSWNPLTDDGDALRLAVKLNIGVQSHAFAGDYSLATNGSVSLAELHEGDPYAATRRAIVRCAAEIGRTL